MFTSVKGIMSSSSVCYNCEELKKMVDRLNKENRDLRKEVSEIQETKDHEGLIHSIRLLGLEGELKVATTATESQCTVS